MQEVGLTPKEPVFVCGPFELFWSTVVHHRDFQEWTVDVNGLLKLEALVLSAKSFRVDNYNRKLTPIRDIASLVSVTQYTASTLPHDKVYGLLGMLPQAERASLSSLTTKSRLSKSLQKRHELPFCRCLDLGSFQLCA